MPRICTVCTHEERAAIDKALIEGIAVPQIIARYSTVHCTIGRMALQRHKGDHLPSTLARAHEVEDLTQALDVVKQLKAINAASLDILSDARKAGDGDLALKAIDRIHKQIELQARLLGELDDRAQINVLLAPEWLHIRAVVLTALEGHPEAKRAVAGSLATLAGANA
jgi:hypothetical protein